jgi:hypothetical protein
MFLLRMTKRQGTEIATIPAACFAEMERLALSAVDVFALMRHKPRWDSLNTLHPFCDLCIPGVLERLVFAGESSLDGLRGRVNLANSWGRTWI